ncbi:glycosyltransferase [bacterium]|nr:glycosyltransferase [bacterium]
MRICMLGYTKFEHDARLHRYALTLLEQGHTVDMIGLGEPIRNEPALVQGVQVYRIYSRDFNESGPVSYLLQLCTFFMKSFFVMTRLQKEKRYHIIHFHNIPDFGVFSTLLARMLGARVILDIHDLVPEFYMRKFQVTEKHGSIVFLKWVERLCCLYADHVITVTEIWRRTLIDRRSVQGPKCSVMMNLPIASHFPRLPFNTHVKGRPFYLTYHGNLAEQTGIDLLIRAVHRIRDRIPELQLQIIGGGREEESYQALARELGLDQRIHFRETVPVIGIADAVRHAHLAVDPKRGGVYAGETLSVKSMEYLALGIPLIVARTMAADYYFPEASVRFFEPDSVESLSEAILDLYDHPAKRKSLYANCDLFNSKYNWNQAGRSYLQLISRLPGRNSVKTH